MMRVFFKGIMPPEMSLATYRRASRQPLFEPMPRGIRRENRDIGGIPGEWITPANAAPDRVLLYLHGGGYVLRTPQVHRVLVGRLARAAGVQAFMADYRLAPENPYPAALDDALAAYRGLIVQGYAPAQIVVAGDSGGGGLAAALLLALRDAGDSLPAAACLLSAMLDCTLSGDALPELQRRDPYLRVKDLAMMAACYYGDHDPHEPLISPLFADLHGLPPLLVHAGECEILSAEAVRYAEKAQAAGVDVTLKVWDDMIHAFPLFAGFVPEGKVAITEVGAFFRKYLP
jgi:monoterpene epsilon-lactone hydrolase